jgi:hypothetical protein
MPQIFGTAPNQVPTNADLGTMAYREANQFYDVGQTVGFRNRIINGDMRIDQRNNGAAVTAGFGYSVDRWQIDTAAGTGGKINQQRNAGSVTPPVGFINYLGMTSTSSYSVLTGDAFALIQRIEGLNVADLGFGTVNAQPVTVSFWVRSSLTGTFGGALQNSAGNRSYPFSYTISAVNTWEQKSVTIPGDTTGTWLTTNGNGITLSFGLGSGSTYSGTAGAWASSYFYTATGATSVVSTNGATFYITGVQLEKGSTATSFDYRTYGTELALCHRYYYRITAQNAFGRILTAGLANSSTLVRPSVQLPTPMRTSVSAVDFGGSMSCYDGTAVFSVSNVAIDVAGINTIGLNVTTSGTTGKQTYQINDSGSGGSYIGFSAEL